MSADRKFDRGWRLLTTKYVRSRLEFLDTQIQDPSNNRRLDYLSEQREWWSAQLPFCYRREGLLAKETSWAK